MACAGENLRLLEIVAPLFRDGAKFAAIHSNPRSARWLFYTELGTELLNLQMNLPDLTLRFSKPSLRPDDAELKCRTLSCELLDLFEFSCAIEDPKNIDNGLSHYIYPYLERLRRDSNLAQERGIIPYNLPNVEGGEDILGRFSAWNKSLVQLIQYSEPERSTEHERTPRPSWNVRRLARSLHCVAAELWKCSCSSPHDYMLFLATYRQFQESHPYILFDMLFSTWSGMDITWRESRVFIMVPGNTESKVQFDLRNCSVRPAPAAKKQIQALCAQVKRITQSSCLNMRLQDSQLYQARLTASKLPGKIASTTTLHDIVCGAAIISFESRIILAVLLAYSVLYLCGSPWLPSGWNKSYFHFLKLKDDVEFLWRPLLSAARSSIIYEKDGLPPGEAHRNPDLLQLGVILLEIFLKKPIEKYREEDDIGYRGVLTTDTNFYTASRVHEEYDWDVHENYKAAVAACLACDLPIDEASFGDLAYCLYIHDEVIRPLEAELVAFCNITPDKLDEVIANSMKESILQTRPALKGTVTATRKPKVAPISVDVRQSPSVDSALLAETNEGRARFAGDFVASPSSRSSHMEAVSEVDISGGFLMSQSRSTRKRLSAASIEGSMPALKRSHRASISPPRRLSTRNSLITTQVVSNEPHMTAISSWLGDIEASKETRDGNLRERYSQIVPASASGESFATRRSTQDSTPSDHEYTVGWICALSIELAASRKMLDKFYGEYCGEEPDNNLYILGRIGNYNVVLTCLPMGRYGNNTAAMVATRMMSKFLNIKIGLMVGIGGGLPSKRNDIRLGDVVVSKPDRQHGGVVQYDMGRFTKDGFERTGALNAPPEKLLSILNIMPPHGAPVGNLPSTPYPGEEFDRLYKPTYKHISDDTCEYCDERQTVKRSPRRHKARPHVFYGTIASGNAVIKDATTRDRLIQRHGVLCVEMEAAGLMNSSFPCLIIRGISDYADSHKNDAWHEYAAAASAQYAKDFLSKIRANVAHDLSSILTDS